MAIHDDDRAGLQRVIRESQVGLTERGALVETLVLSAVAGEHVLVVGPPGTAKSEAVRRVAGGLGGDYFEYLLGRFTEPNEVFGPVDLRRLREGVVEVETTGMLPEAEIAFLDEVFLGSTAILNTLLGLLNERVFRRGATVVDCPLRLCVGATNALPDEITLAAFADRFLVRVFVDPVPDPLLEDLLDAGWRNETPEPTAPIGVEVLDRLVEARRSCDLSAIRPMLGAGIRRMRSAGIELSDRRAVRAQNLIAAAAVIGGRDVASAADLWPLPLIVPTAEGQPIAREVLSDLLAESENQALPHLTEQLSAGPVARARRIIDAVEQLEPLGENVDDVDRRLRLEAILREIDAGFSAETIPEDLTVTRTRLVTALS